MFTAHEPASGEQPEAVGACPPGVGGAEGASEPEGSDICDGDCGTDLTNLAWLTELRCQRSLTWPPHVDDEDDGYAQQSDEEAAGTPEKHPEKGPEPALEARDAAAAKDKTPKRALQYGPPKRKQPVTGRGEEAGAGSAPTKRPTPSERYEMFLDKVKRDLDEYEQYAAAYQSDVNEKPPFNYSHIIGMSMLQNGRVTLQQICSWIEAKFAYFRVRKKWNNSIRHNLSLHHCFRKINRNKYEKGKGGYWELGLDPKKCDRKRIRNRKSAKAKAKGCAGQDPGGERSASQPAGAQILLADSEMAPPPSNEFPVSPNGGDLQPQHYQLGTIIISTLGADVNDFRSLEADANQHIAYLPIIVNSTNQPDGDCLELEPSDTLTVPIEHEPPPPPQGNPNVLVEQSDPRNAACYMIAPSMVAPSAAPLPAGHSPPHCDYANIIGDNFRPYIDGIEEAFQYLRSMDNNREDILDNLLDISVSDY